MDDIIIYNGNSIGITRLKKQLHLHSNLKCDYSIEVVHSKEDIYNSQEMYALDMIKVDGLIGSKPWFEISTCAEISIRALNNTVSISYYIVQICFGTF